jgi:hypothetical protein
VRGSQTPGQDLILAPSPLLIDQQGQAIQKAQFPCAFLSFLLFECLDDSFELQRFEFFPHGLL